ADPKAPMSQALEAAFRPAYPNFRFVVDSFNAGFTFEALLIAAAAFKRASTAEGVPLMQAIRETNIADHVMSAPAITFDDKGQNPGIPSACVQNRNPTPTVVLPAAAAPTTPLLPHPSCQGPTRRRPLRAVRSPIILNPVIQGVPT